MTDAGAPNRPRIRVAAIVVRDGKILLVKHLKEGRAYWLLPGGGVEYGEPLAEALVREVREETGLEVRPDGVVWLSDSIPPDGHRHIVHVWFAAEAVGGTLHCVPDGRVVSAEFMEIERLGEMEIYPPVGEELARICGEGLPGRAEYLGNLWK